MLHTGKQLLSFFQLTIQLGRAYNHSNKTELNLQNIINYLYLGHDTLYIDLKNIAKVLLNYKEEFF
jgi:hypothetical protein